MPDSPFLKGNFAPWPMEGDIRDIEVVGEIPRELEGSYYRNGSNPQFAPAPSYHWFEGDGMIHALHFEGGRCHYRNRWVRTPRFAKERELGERIFGGIGPAGTADPRAEGISGNTSNTHVVWHAGKLLSLWEAGPPYQIDPLTLETVGLHDYDGAFYRERYGSRLPDIMTAHPKLDPDTGEWLGFGYSPLPPHLVYHSVDRDGGLTRSFEVDAPYPSMMHDFVVSAEHVLFPIFPVVFDFEAIANGGLPITWQPERGARIGVMPRDGGNQDVLWIEHEPCFSFHLVNAQTTDQKVIAEFWRFATAPFASGSSGGGPPTLHRWTIDLASGSLKEEMLDDAPAEFGRIDDRYAGKAYRHIYSLGSLDVERMMGEPEGFNSIFHYDLSSGERRAHRLGARDCAGEPVFVPRRDDADEGEGFVLSIVYRSEENRSDVLILDAQNLEREPLATLRLPHRIPFGFHGSWRPAD